MTVIAMTRFGPLGAVLAFAVMSFFPWAAPADMPPLPLNDKDFHMGVATCAGSTCHGSVTPWQGTNVLQNEYFTWQRKDKHAKAYQVLFNEKSKRIARNLGLKSAHTAKICLDCHTDNVPSNRRHRTFQISDGVSCEACHGGAGRWIGTHITADATHERNIAHGLFPSDDPINRARLCLSCHFGDDQRFVTHRIMGAGHPRMSFELDTFTAIQPAHFKVDADYRKRKGRWSGIQIWAIGQLLAADAILTALLDEKRNKDGVFPELVLFDCHSCHRPISNPRWVGRESSGLGPGIPHINDSNILMLRTLAEHVDPALAQEMKSRVRSLHRATRKNTNAVQTEAQALKSTLNKMLKVFARRTFNKVDMVALLNGIIGNGLKGEYQDYAGAEQATMALGTILNALDTIGALDKKQLATLNAALDQCYKAVENDQTFRPATFVKRLRSFQAGFPKL